MSGSVNKVILVGNLGKEPDVRIMQDGGKLVNLTIATSESWKDKNTGERKDKTEWHRVVIFNEALSNVAERFLTKGSKVYIEGQLQTRKYQDKDGNEKYTTEVVVPRFGGVIVMLDNKNSNDNAGGSDWSSNKDKKSESKSSSSNVGEDLDDEIPF